MPLYTEGTCADGAAILKDGEMITIEQVLKELNEATESTAPLGQVDLLVSCLDYHEKRTEACTLLKLEVLQDSMFSDDEVKNIEAMYKRRAELHQDWVKMLEWFKAN
jgi:hypothetical protein